MRELLVDRDLQWKSSQEGYAEWARQRMTRATEMLVDGTLARDRYDALCTKAEADRRSGARRPWSSRHRWPERSPTWTVLVKVGGWAESLLRARTPTQREIVGQLIERVTAPRNGPKRRWLGQDYYDVEIVWTEPGRALRDVAKALTAVRAA